METMRNMFKGKHREIVSLKIVRLSDIALDFCPPDTDKKKFVENLKANFREQLRLLLNIQHPNILPLLEAWIEPERVVMAYPCKELFSPTTLREFFIDMDVQERIKSARIYVKQIVNGLKKIHRQMMVHMSLTPRNIYVEYGKTWKSVGGMCVRIGDLTMKFFGKAEGTDNRYKPPELVHYIDMREKFGDDDLRTKEAFDVVQRNPKSIDSYSLGIILMELVAGRVPRTLYTKKKRLVRIPRCINRPSLRNFIARCCRYRPVERIGVEEMMNHDFFRDDGRGTFSQQQQGVEEVFSVKFNGKCEEVVFLENALEFRAKSYKYSNIQNWVGLEKEEDEEFEFRVEIDTGEECKFRVAKESYDDFVKLFWKMYIASQ